MNRCARVRALRSCSGDVHVARVVASLVVHAVVGLTLGLIVDVVVVVFVVEFPWPFFCVWRKSLCKCCVFAVVDPDRATCGHRLHMLLRNDPLL